MFDIVRSRMDKVDCEVNEVNIYFCITLTKHDAKIVSLYKYVIWKIRNLSLYSNLDILKVFKSLFFIT